MKPKLYPIVDIPSYADQKRLGCKPMMSRIQCRVVRTGEFREPKAGEWYLSGAIPEGYKTKKDRTTKYHICRLVRVETKHVVIETIVKELRMKIDEDLPSDCGRVCIAIPVEQDSPKPAIVLIGDNCSVCGKPRRGADKPVFGDDGKCFGCREEENKAALDVERDAKPLEEE